MDPGKTLYMNNADFRQILEQSKQERGEDEAAPAPKPTKKKQSKKRTYKEYQQIKEQKQEEREAANKYRDRASERRNDANPDYEGITKALEIDIEHSKYLGGDVQHTHLVKGLDFALLSRMRSDLTSLKSEHAKLRQAGGSDDDDEELLSSEPKGK